ncbi:mitochondrial enolase superfamily member 1 [Grus japonensis]|uniref:Mitochondrial enolase superfamily member 1 n=1 Tax=Grus japonensis TaxID=30415 RepID=A0ABC9W065_GRUJA
MAPDGMHPQVQREVAAVIVRPLSMIFEIFGRSAQRLEKSKYHSDLQERQEGGPRELLTGQPHLDPLEGDGTILENISRHLKDKKIIRSSQYGFTKGKSYLTNLITFYGEMAGLVDEGRAVYIVYLDFSKAFDTVSHKIHIEKLLNYGLDE